MKKIKGFSLIELMITVAIIGILMLMAQPLYKNYIIKVDIQKMVSVIDYELARPLAYAFVSGTTDGMVESGGSGMAYDGDTSGIEGQCKTHVDVASAAIEEFKKKYNQPAYYNLYCPDADDAEYGQTRVVARLNFQEEAYSWNLELSALGETYTPASGSNRVTILTGKLDPNNGGIANNFELKRELAPGTVFCDIDMYAGEYMLQHTQVRYIMPKQCRHIYLNYDGYYAEF